MSSWPAESPLGVAQPARILHIEPVTRPRAVAVYELGLTRYADVLDLQRHLQSRRREGQGVDALLLTQHEPVLTLGRSHPEPDLRVAPDVLSQLRIDVVQTERGGDITYH